MDLQDLNDLREAYRCLQLMERPGTSAADVGALRQQAKVHIERVLNKHPLVKDPVGGLLDVRSTDSAPDPRGQHLDVKLGGTGGMLCD